MSPERPGEGAGAPPKDAARPIPSGETTERPEQRPEFLELVSEDEIRAFFARPEFQQETDPQRQHELLAYWLSERRNERSFALPDIDTAHAPFTDDATHEYAVWDYGRAEDILRAYGPGAASEAAPATVPPPEQSRPDHPEPPQPRVSVRDRRRAGIIDVESKIEEVARHRADERLNRELRGDFGERDQHSWWRRAGDRVVNLFRRSGRRAAEEMYRQRYIQQERDRILTELGTLAPNPFAPEEHTPAAFRAESGAIIERFLLDYEEAVRTREGERRESLAEGTAKQGIRELVAQYANGEIDDAVFNEQKQTVLDVLRVEHPDLYAQEHASVDNLLEIARDIRACRDHGERIAAMDLDLDIQLGTARSAIKDESHLRTFDRLLKRIQRTPVLSHMVNPAMLGLTFSLGSNALMSATRMGLRAAGVAAPIVGAVAGGAFAGLRRSMELKGDVAHVRRATAMGYEPTAGAERIERLREFTYDQRAVPELQAAIANHAAELGRDDLPDAERQAHLDQLVALVGETEARLDVSTTLRHDFLQFGDPTHIERGRLDLLRSVAEARIALRNTGVDTTVQIEQAYNDQQQRLMANVEDVDRRFGRFKNVQVARQVAFGAATGFVAGAAAQWAYSEFREHVLHQQNAPESAIEKLWDKISGHEQHENPGTPYEYLAGDNTKLDLPEGCRVIEHNGLFSIVDEDGAAVHDPFQLTPDGKLPDDVKADFLRNGWLVSEHDVVEHSVARAGAERVTETSGKAPTVDEWLKQHPEGRTGVFRPSDAWLDENTHPATELNELREDFALTENGDYKVSIARMTPEGSFHKDLHPNVKELLAKGDIRILLSATRDSQKLPFELIPDQDGNVIIPKDSPLGKFLFNTEGGKVKFLGKFSEAAMLLRDEHGELIKNKAGEQGIRMFATAVGEGLPNVPTDELPPPPLPDRIIHEYDFLKPRDWDMPPVIPFSRRNPLEAFQRRRFIPPYLEGGYFRDDARNRERWAQDRSPRLKENREARLNQQEEIDWYFQQQEAKLGKAYLNELDDRIEKNQALKELSPDTRIVVCMPVAAAYEADNVYNTLRLYAQQEGDTLDETTILMNVNWRETDDAAAVQRTMAEIERARADFPHLKVALFTKEWSKEFIESREGRLYGAVVKELNDTALRAIQKASPRGEVYLLTNDADTRGMSKRYLQSLRQGAEAEPNADGFLGKIEWGSEVYEDNPGFHVSARFMQYIDSVYRHQGTGRNVASSGANFMVRAGTFAAVGGYDRDMGAGADTDLGRRIKAARLGGRTDIAADRYPIQYNNGAWIDTDPSRALKYYREGIPIVKMWDAFDEGGYEPRGDLKLGAAEVEGLRTNFDEIVKRSEYQINEMLRLWVGFEHPEVYGQALDAAFPARDGKASWEVSDGPEGTKVFLLTEAGREWLKEQLETYAAQNKKDILYRKRGIRAGRPAAGTARATPRRSATGAAPRAPFTAPDEGPRVRRMMDETRRTHKVTDEGARARRASEDIRRRQRIG